MLTYSLDVLCVSESVYPLHLRNKKRNVMNIALVLLGIENIDDDSLDMWSTVCVDVGVRIPRRRRFDHMHDANVSGDDDVDDEDGFDDDDDGIDTLSSIHFETEFVSSFSLLHCVRLTSRCGGRGGQFRRWYWVGPTRPHFERKS